MITSCWTIFYGLMVLIGGVMGYVSKKSKPSLIAGGIFGIALITTGVVSFQRHFQGILVALILTVFLTILFGIRYKKTGKFMPAGLVLGLSLLSLVILGLGLVKI